MKKIKRKKRIVKKFVCVCQFLWITFLFAILSSCGSGGEGSNGIVQPDPNKSTMVATPEKLVADGVAISTITVTVLDSNGNPVPGATVTLSSSRGATDTISQPVATTDSNGRTTGTVVSIAGGATAISAVASGVGITQKAAVSFMDITPPSPITDLSHVQGTRGTIKWTAPVDNGTAVSH